MDLSPKTPAAHAADAATDVGTDTATDAVFVGVRTAADGQILTVVAARTLAGLWQQAAAEMRAEVSDDDAEDVALGAEIDARPSAVARVVRLESVLNQRVHTHLVSLGA